MPSPLVMADPMVLTPPGRLLWTTEDMYNPARKWPQWSTGIMGMTFFNMRHHKIYDHLRQGHGEAPEMGISVSPPRGATGPEYRYWRLYDIECFAHALAYHKVITASRLTKAVIMVKTCAQQHGYL